MKKDKLDWTYALCHLIIEQLYYLQYHVDKVDYVVGIQYVNVTSC